MSQPVRRWAKNEWIVLKSTITTHINTQGGKKSRLCAVKSYTDFFIQEYTTTPRYALKDTDASYQPSRATLTFSKTFLALFFQSKNNMYNNLKVCMLCGQKSWLRVNMMTLAFPVAAQDMTVAI